MEEDVPIEHRMVSKAIENAQKKVEANNYEIRKHLLQNCVKIINPNTNITYDYNTQGSGLIDAKALWEVISNSIRLNLEN